MACLAGAHFTVGGILHRSAGVTRLDFRYTLHIEEYGFGTPETPGAKSSYLGISTHFIFVWFLTMTQACGTQGYKKKGRIFHYPYNRISASILNEELNGAGVGNNFLINGHTGSNLFFDRNFLIIHCFLPNLDTVAVILNRI